MIDVLTPLGPFLTLLLACALALVIHHHLT